jgi:hypothetical protein
MSNKDWIVRVSASPEPHRPQRPDATLRMILLGERAMRILAGTSLIVVTALLCLVAVVGPETLLSARADGLPRMLTRLRFAIADMFG